MDIRASSNPALMECPGSGYPEPDEPLVNLSDPAGALGTATHDALEAFVNDKDVSLTQIKQRRGIADNQIIDLKIMTAIGKIFWREYKEFFPNPETEPAFDTTIDGHTFTGHIDILSVNGEWAHIIDWKTTRIEGKNYFWQMFRYCWLVMKKNPEVKYFTYTIVFVRDKSLESNNPEILRGVKPFTRDELAGRHDQFCDRVFGWDKQTYCPGIECHYCQRILHCKAHTRYIAKTLETLALFDSREEMEEMANGAGEQTCVKLYQDIRAIESFLGMAVASIKLRCEASGDRLRGDKGKDLIMREQVKDNIIYGACKDLLQESFTEDEIDEFLQVSKTAMLNVVNDKAPRGLKEKAKDSIMSKLRQGGGVISKAYKVPAIVRHIPGADEKAIEGE